MRHVAHQWLVHAAGTYIHEQAHRLIVRREPYATAVDALLEACMTSFGQVVGYQYRHSASCLQ